MIHHGDCLEVLAGMKVDSVDACVTDPPYGISFMGRDWDKARSLYRTAGGVSACDGMPSGQRSTTATENREFQAWCERWAGEVLRVLKPGAYLAAFGSPRLYHRLGCAIEDAGFECKDGLAYIHAMGFPKSRNRGVLGTALKPAMEPIVLAQKPRGGTYDQCHEKHGTGYLNIDDARVPLDGETIESNVGYTSERQAEGWGTKRCVTSPTTRGRWPANVVHDGSDAVRGEFPHVVSSGRKPSQGSNAHNTSMFRFGGIPRTSVRGGDGGNATRFFYCTKPSPGEKEAGLDGQPMRTLHRVNPGGLENEPRFAPLKRRNIHPTIKPIELMRWLIRLCCPPGGLVLDPFLGSGTTAIAAHLEQRPWIGIERDAEYLEIARARTAWWSRQTPGRSVESILGGVKPDVVVEGQGRLFG